MLFRSPTPQPPPPSPQKKPPQSNVKELTKIDGYEFLCLCGLEAITLAKEVELYFVASCEVLSCTNQVTFSFPFVQRLYCT